MTFLLVALALFFCYRMDRRLRAVEKRLESPFLDQENPVSEARSVDQTAEHSVIPPQKSVRIKEKHTNSASRLVQWLLTDWLLKLGSLLVLLGLGWFVSYAFAQNWIGPIGRITFGLMLGALIFCLGFWRAYKNEHQGTVILGLGAAVMITTIYAAREVYDFFTPEIALFMMASVSACIATSSVMQRVPSRALLGLLVAAIAPFLTVSASPSVIGVFVYLFVVIAATVWVVVVTGWIELLVAAVGVYAVFSVITLPGRIPATDVSTLTVLVAAFTILFYGIGVISALRTKHVLLADLFIKALSALMFIAWVYELVPDYLQALVVLAGSALTVLGAWILFTQTQNRVLVLLHGSLSLVYLAVATAMQLDGPSAVIAYAALTTVGVYLAGKLTNNYVLAQRFGLPFIFIIFYCVGQLNSPYNPYTSRLNQPPESDMVYQARGGKIDLRVREPSALWSEIAVVMLISAVLFALGNHFYTLAPSTEVSRREPLLRNTVIYLCAGLVLALIAIWYAAGRIYTAADTAHAVALCIYAVIGISVYAYGLLLSHTKTRIVGSVLLGLVVLRLLFVEVWNMLLVQRVIVFVLIGSVLMAGAFLRPRKTTA